MLFALLFLCVCSTAWLQLQCSDPPPPCTCSPPSLCEPISAPQRPELVIFGHGYNNFDWTKITTIVWHGVETWDPNAICFAHSHNARVILSVSGLTTEALQNQEATNAFINDALSNVVAHSMDGVNLLFNDVIAVNDNANRQALTDFVGHFAQAVHNKIQGSQFSFNVPWMPNADQRFYDYAEIAKLVDILFVMDYDEQSQIFGSCRAGPTSHYLYLAQGMNHYKSLEIHPNQLVMGLPWYGKDFTCIDQVNETVCPIQPDPYRGVQCSDQNAPKYPYSVISSIYLPIATYNSFDVYSHSPFMNYNNSTDQHQIWYDNPMSIKDKVTWAKIYGKIGGVGVFTGDDLDYGDSKQVHNFWSAVNFFFL